MDKNSVKIVKLEAMRLASAWAFGPSPEEFAWKKMEAWAIPLGLLEEDGKRRMFGFNNPNPSHGSPNYGYEFCLSVDASVTPTGDIRIKDFAGGLYAVMVFNLGDGDPGEAIPAGWQKLDAWVAENGYRHGGHQWLEEHTLAGNIIALYYPIAEK